MSTPKLQVAICTCGPRGLDRVGSMRLPRLDGVGYLVSCQSDERELPQTLQRPDVQVVFTPTRGLSRNRNVALRHATAPLVVIADDDLNYYPEGLEGVIEAFDKNPDIDILAFECAYPEPKRYPDGPCSLWHKVSGYEPCSVEMAVRVAPLRERGVWFDPSLGLGAERFTCAEEAVMLLNARRAGLKGMFVPLVVCEHPQEPTGYKLPLVAGVIEAQGLYMGLVFSASLLPRIVLKTWRTPGPKWRTLRLLLSGARYARRHRRELLISTDAGSR